jgi:hypothetical protein
MTIITRGDLLIRAAAPALLASCKELRDALAGAMRVIASHASDSDELTEAFVAEMARLHIPPGIGVRADDVIARAEGRPRPVPVEPEPEIFGA